MTSVELAAAISNRLRRRGVDFRPAELEAFTADIGQATTDAPDLDMWAARFIEFRRPTAQVSWGWRRFRRVFAVWFAVLMAFFLLANLAGVVNNGLHFGDTGFPFTFAIWGVLNLRFFRWSILALNVLIAVVVSALVGTACAVARYREALISSPWQCD